MRWAKIVGLLAAGIVFGGLLTGYVVWEYMVRFGIDWNQWASSQFDEQRAAEALGTVSVLSKIHTGKVDEARNVLEWRLTNEIVVLAAMKKASSDPKGYRSKALLAIKDYRQASPWSSGNQELDKSISDILGEAVSRPSQAR